MCLNPVNEEFDRAYANVGLLASDVWSYQKEEVDYKKANLYLWIRFNETEKRLIEEDSSDDDVSTTTEEIRTVRDVIPFSRLATYNNFEYNEEREKMYVSEYVPEYAPANIQNLNHVGHKNLEVWMLPEVDIEFKKYAQVSHSGWCTLSPEFNSASSRNLVSMEKLTNVRPTQWLSETQWPEQLLSRYAEKLFSLRLSSEHSVFRNDLVPPAYEPDEVEDKLEDYPCPRYLIETNIDHKLHEIISSPGIKNLWVNPSYRYGSYTQSFGLNAEVPEFQPVTFSSKFKVEGENFEQPLNNTQIPKDLHQIAHGLSGHEPSFEARQQHYISIFDMNYEAEVFPYSIASIDYPVQPEVLKVEENQAVHIPMFENSSESYFNFVPLKQNWKKQQENISSHLSALSESEQYGVEEYKLEPWMHLDRNLFCNKIQSTEKMIEILDKWLCKIYNPRSTDFTHMVSSSHRINKIFQNVQQSYCLVQGPAVVPPPTVQRPLYSDVLMSEVNTASCSETKFDELEQEALEQYSGSDTTLKMSSPGNSAVQQSKHQVSEKLDVKNENSTPRPPSQDSGSASQITPLLSPETKCGGREVVLCTFKGSHESIASELSSASESKRLNQIEPEQVACCLNRQVKWMKKKKKKTQKKKKNAKHNNNKKVKLTVDPNNKFVESEIIFINKFLELDFLFKQTFFQENWKLVQERLTVQVKNSFKKCLMMFEECLEWFVFLIMNRDANDDVVKTKKRNGLIRNIVNLSENLLTSLHQYVYFYSKIKMTIPCDHRLYLDPNKLIKQRAITAAYNWGLTVPLIGNNFCQKVGLLTTVPNGKYLLRLLNSVVQEENLTLIYKHEWKLPHISDMPTNRRTNEIQINFKEWRIHLVECDIEKEEPNINSSRKLLKIVEDFPIWYSWQWKCIDGWKLDISDSAFSFQWCNQFNVRILEQVATSARIIIMSDWLLDLIDAVVLNKQYPSCEVLWNSKTPNLISSKMVFFRVLLKKDIRWFFGDVRINQQACCRLYSGCENSCCVSWIMNYNSVSMNTGPSMSFVKPHKKRTQKIMVRSITSGCKKEDTKDKNNQSKSKCRNNLSPEKQLTFKKMVSDEIDLPQEKSSCVIQ